MKRNVFSIGVAILPKTGRVWEIIDLGHEILDGGPALDSVVRWAELSLKMVEVAVKVVVAARVD